MNALVALRTHISAVFYPEKTEAPSQNSTGPFPSLGDLVLRLFESDSQSQLLQSATQWLHLNCQMTSVLLYTYDRASCDLVNPVVAGRDISDLPQKIRLGLGVFGEVARLRFARLIDNVPLETRLGPVAAEINAAYLIPLVSGSDLYGVLCCQSESQFPPSTLGLVDRAGTLIAAHLSELLRYTSGQQTIARFDRFQTLAQKLTDRLDSQELLQEIVEAAREMLDTEMSILLNLEDAEKGELRPVAWAGIDTENARMLRSSYKEDLRGLVAWARRPARTADLHTDQRTALANHAVGVGMRSELAVPVLHFDKLYGVLAVETEAHRDFTDEEMNLLSSLAAHAGIALRNAQLFEHLQQMNRQLEKTVADLVISQQQAENARLSAVEANKLKTEFVNNMSHELRTPLNAVINFTRIVADGHAGPIAPTQAQYLGYVHDSGQHLLGLINDILDLAKIEAGKMELRRENTALEPILRGIMSTAVGLTRDKGLALKQEMEPDLPLLHIDGTRIRQVLLNLLSNAAKFTPQGSITLRAKREGQQVIVSVQDTGIGIKAEDLPKVFEEFRQIDGSLQRTEAGTGLGMPISKRFIELHNGTMWIESETGVGTTVYFSLPIQDKPLPES